jgi:hypothetical protein
LGVELGLTTPTEKNLLLQKYGGCQATHRVVAPVKKERKEEEGTRKDKFPVCDGWNMPCVSL